MSYSMQLALAHYVQDEHDNDLGIILDNPTTESEQIVNDELSDGRSEIRQ